MTGKPGRSGRPKMSDEGFDVQIGVRLPPSLVKELDAAAEEDGTDRSSVVRAIIDGWAKRRARKGKAKR